MAKKKIKLKFNFEILDIVLILLLICVIGGFIYRINYGTFKFDSSFFLSVIAFLLLVVSLVKRTKGSLKIKK